MVIGIIVYVWKQISHMEASKDETLVSLNKAEFNQAFLAYEKNLMYGTDVLSCLNKAQNNNQRYVYNNYYGTDKETIGADTRSEFYIDVEITLSSALSERLTVYYKDSSGKLIQLVGSHTGNNFSDKLFDGAAGHFKVPESIIYYYFEQGKLKKATTSYAQAMWTDSNKMKSTRTIQELLGNSDLLQTSFSRWNISFTFWSNRKRRCRFR
jgi:hypothetical protein